MTKRAQFKDTTAIALIYISRATGGQIISYDKALEFNEIVNENLDKINSPITPYFFLDDDSKFCFYVKDVNNNGYFVINQNADIKRAQTGYIGCVPIDIVVASQMSNALDILDLEKINGNIVVKKHSEVMDRFMDKLKNGEFDRKEPKIDEEVNLTSEFIEQTISNYKKILDLGIVDNIEKTKKLKKPL